MRPYPKKICFIRADRLGDLILSTPVFDAYKKRYPDSRISVLARSPFGKLIEGLDCVDEWIEYDPANAHAGKAGIHRLSQELSGRKFDAAVVLHSQLPIAQALKKAKIKRRIAQRSRFHSYFYYNETYRQNRSKSDRHEAEYGLDLCVRAGLLETSEGEGSTPSVSISPDAQERAMNWLTLQGWTSDQPFVVVHPGMGGSALNASPAQYRELLLDLKKQQIPVVLSFGPMDQKWEQDLDLSSEFWVWKGGQDLEAFAGLISYSALVVAPSTGPLHLAGALKKPVLSVYPPIQVQSAKRWGPFRPENGSARVLEPGEFIPSFECGQKYECIGKKCAYYFCMDQIPMSAASAWIENQLKEM